MKWTKDKLQQHLIMTALENKELQNMVVQYENELRKLQKEYTELLKDNKQLRLTINELQSLNNNNSSYKIKRIICISDIYSKFVSL